MRKTLEIKRDQIFINHSLPMQVYIVKEVINVDTIHMYCGATFDSRELLEMQFVQSIPELNELTQRLVMSELYRYGIASEDAPTLDKIIWGMVLFCIVVLIALSFV